MDTRFLIGQITVPFRWMPGFQNPEGQLSRWLEVISTYDMDIEHLHGPLHGNADGFCRDPYTQCGYFDVWEKTEVNEDYDRTLKQEVQSSSAESKTLVEIPDEISESGYKACKRLDGGWYASGIQQSYC